MRHASLLVVGAILALISPATFPQAFPSKPVRMMVVASHPVAAPTSSRASSRRSCRKRGVNRSWSRTGRTRRRPSPQAPWRKRRADGYTLSMGQPYVR
jgi:hypothetical protein